MKILLIAFLSMLSFSSLAAEKPLAKVLLISGQNNHKWQQTTPLIVETLKSTRRFEVEVSEKFEAFSPARLSEFDVIFSNWNLWKQRKNLPPELDWSPELRKAYVDFVRNGGGHVAMHAGSSTFFDWKEYQEICIATWKSGTHHGPKHMFEVRIEEKAHPITLNLGNFKKYDELWEKLYISAKDVTILTSSFASSEFKGDNVWEPSTLVSRFGKGRTAYTSLGHDAKAFESNEFRVLLARLTEWAATGKVTISPTSRNDTKNN